MPHRSLACLIAAVALLAAGCDAEQLIEQFGEKPSARVKGRQTAHRGAADSPAANAPMADGATISIASFNIQVFGVSKMKKPKAMAVLVKVIRQFDVVAVQELRSKDQTIAAKFVQMINAEGANYDFVLGPRLGRSSSKEQYLFIFNADRIEVDRVYTAKDKNDLLHREPLVAQFRVRGPPQPRPFSFKLINIHTDPDETDQELDALADVFQAVQQDGDGEDDVILLGDLNVNERHLGRLGKLRNIKHALSGVKTNTRGTKSYDNIVFNRIATVEYTGRFGVLDLMREFHLSKAEALRVSDHMPVWAVFSAFEDAGAGGEAARRGSAAPH